MSAQNVYRFFIVRYACVFFPCSLLRLRYLVVLTGTLMSTHPAASVMVASKFLDDHYCRNSYFAAAGGMTTTELNALEVRFCFLMDFKLAVSTEEYEACVSAVLAGEWQHVVE